MAEVFATATVGAHNRIGQTAVLRASAATTTSYVATNHIRCADGVSIVFNFDLTWVDSTSQQWYVEWSDDGTTWRRETSTSNVAGVWTHVVKSQSMTLGASTSWTDGQELNAPRTALGAYCRLQVKKTGGGGADALAVSATIFVDRN